MLLNILLLMLGFSVSGLLYSSSYFVASGFLLYIVVTDCLIKSVLPRQRLIFMEKRVLTNIGCHNFH